MADKEKFDGFGQKWVEENEKKYGKEIRAKFGEEAVERSNAKIKGMSKEQFAEVEALRTSLEDALKKSFEQGDPASEFAQKACDLHRQWLCYFYDNYSKEYHIGLGEMYVVDKRFRDYYDKIAPGCAEFLRDAIRVYCK